MGRAKLTLMGMYYWWMNNEEGDFFDSLNLPTSSIISAANLRTQVKNTILANGGEFGCLYGDPSWMRTMMSMWSGSMLPIWQRTLDAIELSYDPLENYNRQEEWSESASGSSSRSGKDSDTGKLKRSETENEQQSTAGTSKTDSSGNPMTKQYTSAYNGVTENAFAPESREDITIDQTDESSSVSTGSRDNTRSGDETHTRAGTRSEDEQHTQAGTRIGRAHGNIGTLTNQEMLISEFQVALQASIYNMICDDFMRQFLILCY